MLPRLIPLVLLLRTLGTHGAKKDCGGIYTAARGILQTPNFPGPFNVPLDCEWVIDAQHMMETNSSIVVYLTQLFVFEGLTFTEYLHYGNGYNINPKVIHRVNETNISKIRWVQSFQSFLVIQLKLPSLESAHIRVLDKFLDVYGFNITYEINTGIVRPNSCTMMDCGFTGICYDHYTKFTCDCFNGFSGPHCSEGPKSVCYNAGVPICKNGGTCMHVGVSAVRCHCPKNYTGNTCEIPVSSNKECAACKVSCSYDGRLESSCKCGGRNRGNWSVEVIGDRQSGFTTTLHLSNLPYMDEEKLKDYIKDQLLRILQHNLSRVEDVSVLSVMHFASGADVSLRIFGPKDDKRLRSILTKWRDRGYFGNITIAEKDITNSPLSLQGIAINQPGAIRERDEFILSCVARGGPSIAFRWFKDGAYVNATASSNRKWIKLIKDPHVADQYTSLLAVPSADRRDSGTFQCQTFEGGRQQCISKKVRVAKAQVAVKVEPMSVTVRKGGNFTIKCITLEEDGIGEKYIYSWTKNKVLLPVKTETERYEILYPSGTILQVVRAEKDVHYSCLVQSQFGSSERHVWVKVVDPKVSSTCPGQIPWPETAPDTESIIECPQVYRGKATRYCELRDGKIPKWSSPDYSGCTHRYIEGIYEKFESYKLGYMNTAPTDVLQGFLAYLKRNGTNILPGEGAKILELTHNVVIYLQTLHSRKTIANVTNIIFSLLDHILSVPSSIIKSPGVRLVLELLNSHFYNIAIGLLTSNITEYYRMAKNTIDITLVNLSAISVHENYFHIPTIPLTENRSKSWNTVQFSGTKNKYKMLLTSRLVNGVIFRNLSRFLPPRSFLRQKDGSELEYEIYSQIISIMTLPENLDIYPIAIDFKHELHSNMNWSDDETWTVRCGYADAATFAYTWDIYSCHTEMLSEEKTRCICPKSGVFALLLTLVPHQPASEDNDPRKLILIVGCSLCIALTLSTTICLTVSFWLARQSCVMALKLQCSVSVFVTGLLFLLAITTGPPQNHLMLFLTSLEAFFLLGMSSHLSKVLIVFTEIIQTPRPVVSKYTVMGIISGVPVITVFGSHLVYKTMEIRLNSWWMVTGSLAFNIFVTVISIMTILFIFLYIVVMTKLNELLFVHDKLQKPIEKRVALLKRSGFIFSAVTLFSVSSIIYINYPNELWSIYQFSAYNVFLGLILLFCYVLKSETQIKYMFKSKAKKNPEDKFFSFDSSSTPINFLTKEEGEVDNKCSPDIKDTQQFTLRTVEMPKPILKKPKVIPETHDGCFHTSTSFCSTQLDEVGESPQSPLELYSNSPQPFRKFANPQSPDILANKVCTGLDLVASSLHVVTTEPIQRPIYPPKVIITPDDAIAKILESETVIVQDENSQNSSGHERTQPDGRDEIVISEATAKTLNGSCKSESDYHSKEVTVEIVPPPPDLQKPSTSTSKDSLNGVLDSINQDLAYLLSDDAREQVVTLRRVSKTVLQEIPEELSEEAGGDLPESITLRTSC